MLQKLVLFVRYRHPGEKFVGNISITLFSAIAKLMHIQMFVQYLEKGYDRVDSNYFTMHSFHYSYLAMWEIINLQIVSQV